jgi:hypothetical protein
MLTFHGKQDLKDHKIAQVRARRARSRLGQLSAAAPVAASAQSQISAVRTERFR